MYCVLISEQTATSAIYTIIWLVFITEMKSLQHGTDWIFKWSSLRIVFKWLTCLALLVEVRLPASRQTSVKLWVPCWADSWLTSRRIVGLIRITALWKWLIVRVKVLGKLSFCKLNRLWSNVVVLLRILEVPGWNFRREIQCHHLGFLQFSSVSLKCRQITLNHDHSFHTLIYSFVWYISGFCRGVIEAFDLLRYYVA
jgi:hypothetical protein